jgi:subtilase family serine protease
MCSNRNRLAFAGLVLALSACNSSDSGTTVATGSGSGTITSCHAQAAPHAVSSAVQGKYLETNISGLKKLSSHIPRAAQKMTDQGKLDETQQMPFSVMLSLNDQAGLDQELADMYNPSSQNYHHFLTPEEFRTKYSPTEAQVSLVKTYLASKGITVTSVNDNRTLIRSSANVAAINGALHTEIHQYQDTNGASYFAPAYELQTSSALPIQSVLGLQNMVKAKKHLVKGNARASASVSGITPATIRSAYDLPSSVTGSGQSLALMELDGYAASDITAYEKQFSLTTVPLSNVLVDGATGSAGGGADEVTLDIELMIAVAPGASQITVYEGPNDDSGILDVYDKIASDNTAKQISSSWGSTEDTSSFGKSENTVFQQMSAQGQSVYAAAGDSGAYDNGSTLSVGDPASQPYVVGVGGTTLTTSNSGAYSSETTWNDGGGGVSTVWTIPSWQVGAATSSSTLGSTTMRNVPDVSLNADPDTGYAIYVGGTWTEFGGTSCAAPLWAAFTALVNEQRISNGMTDLGFPNPSLYAIGKASDYGSDFHDISDNSTNQYYPAVSGYDNATGLGSFNGANLFRDLTQGALGTTGGGGSCS